MDELAIVTFFWGDRYSPAYVERLARGVKRNLTRPHRFICVSDADESFGAVVETVPLPDEDLTRIPGCFARLRVFDPQWQAAVGISQDAKIVVMDLDAVVVGELDPLFERSTEFTILQGVNSASHPCRYNGSLWMLRAGYAPDVWDHFSLDEAEKAPKLHFADDQGWMAYTLPHAGAFTSADGVYAFMKPGWPAGIKLPANARFVAFPGARDPREFTHLPWVRDHWKA